MGWAAYPFSSDLSDPGIEPGSPALQADSLPAELPGKTPGEASGADRRSVRGPGRSHTPGST